LNRTLSALAAPLEYGAAVINLQPGWNIITNPFDVRVSWTKVQFENGIADPIWQYNGASGFAISSTLQPYAGYYFENTQSRTSLKIPCPYFSSSPASTPEPFTWRVHIALSSGDYVDQSASFGVAPGASDQRDRFDFRKPRGLAETPMVSFSRPAWDAQYSSFATDIRPEFIGAQSWEFDVNAMPHTASQLAFTGLKKISAPFEVYLIDGSKARAINLREDSLYRFTPAAAMNKFAVVVGAKDAVKNQLDNLALPQTFTLGPNYPNPFWSGATSRFAGNPETTIPLTIAATSAVKLQVFNALGQEVKTLYDGTLEAGKYWFSWDGRNHANDDAAAGVYLYRLTTNTNVVLTKKMVLLR
jgi:hypothetical protein